MVEEVGDMILFHFPVTLMIIMAFSIITDTGKVIVVLDLIIDMQYKMRVCKIVIPIKAHINREVNPVIEASISNIVGSSTNIVDSRRVVDKAKEGVCNFIGITNIPLPSPQGLTACPIFNVAFSLLKFTFIHNGPTFYT
jgi:hypothetical protein